MTQQTKILETLGRSIEDTGVTWHDMVVAAKMPYRQRSVSKALVALCVSGHAEKTPSLWMYPSNTFKCYGCEWHGRMQHFILDQVIMKPTDLIDELGIKVPQDICPDIDLYYNKYMEERKRDRDALSTWPDEPF